MRKEKLKRALVDIGKDILVAFTIVCIVMLALFAYCGIWPPMVVVESGSMQRYDEKSVIGVIDTGDMVFVKKIGGVDDIITYVDGEATGYSKYGAFGDVIIYRPNGLSEREDGEPVIPIIHRPVVWIDVNDSMVNPGVDDIDYANFTFDVPSLGIYASTETIMLRNYGFWNDTIIIDLEDLLAYYKNSKKTPHGGYITMGDNNAPFYDQRPFGFYEPVLPEWIVGKAIGEIPWFGLIKLKVTGAPLYGVPGNSWTNLYATIFIVLFVPFMLDMLLPRLKRRMKDRAKAKSAVTGEAPATPEAPEPASASADEAEADPPDSVADAGAENKTACNDNIDK